ncbi:unnamed protein product, partial [Ectocarpus sp. 13 AM-2016]
GGHYSCEEGDKVLAEGGGCEGDKGLAVESVESVPSGPVAGVVAEGGDCEEEDKGLADESVEAVPNELVSEGGDCDENDKKLAVESVEAVPNALVSEGGDCEEEDKELAVESREAPEALRLDDMPNPYEDFDELHDRDYYTARTVQLACKTPGDIFNFCRPRSGTVYQSASGSGPGFFSDADDGNVAGEAIEDGGAVGKATDNGSIV